MKILFEKYFFCYISFSYVFVYSLVCSLCSYFESVEFTSLCSPRTHLYYYMFWYLYYFVCACHHTFYLPMFVHCMTCYSCSVRMVILFVYSLLFFLCTDNYSVFVFIVILFVYPFFFCVLIIIYFVYSSLFISCADCFSVCVLIIILFVSSLLIFLCPHC